MSYPPQPMSYPPEQYPPQPYQSQPVAQIPTHDMWDVEKLL
jgi:hypothetical protein